MQYYLRFTNTEYQNVYNGKFELANGGTVFLDEIGEMPITLQPKLLRAIQELEIERIGGTETIKLDVRILAATNRDLQIEIDNKRFREDLFFRLNVFPIVIPPLRDRLDDIPVLVNYFVDKFSARYHKNIEYISSDHLDAMKSYQWPGNIRELENLIERGVIISNKKVLNLDFFANSSNENSLMHIGEIVNSKSFESLNMMQKNYIEKVLKSTKGKISGPNGAAEILDINPNTLRDRIKKLGININNSNS